jgi:BolA family transcriptional regulator, general stress-responsive regulator
VNRLEWIERTLRDAFAPAYLEVIDDSSLHAGHVGAEGGGGHYQVVIVAERFRGLSRIERHRAVYDALGDAMRDRIHALALRALAPDEER